MSSYYYFSASLPLLKADGPLPITSDQFAEESERLMTSSDASILASARLNCCKEATPENAFMASWVRREAGLRNEITKIRARKKNADAESHIMPELIDPSSQTKAREITDEPSPFKAEVMFNNVLWQYLDEMEVGHLFDLEFLIAYYLKLQILERNQSFDKESGRKKLESILTGDTQNG